MTWAVFVRFTHLFANWRWNISDVMKLKWLTGSACPRTRTHKTSTAILILEVAVRAMNRMKDASSVLPAIEPVRSWNRRWWAEVSLWISSNAPAAFKHASRHAEPIRSAGAVGRDAAWFNEQNGAAIKIYLCSVSVSTGFEMGDASACVFVQTWPCFGDNLHPEVSQTWQNRLPLFVKTAQRYWPLKKKMKYFSLYLNY